MVQAADIARGYIGAPTDDSPATEYSAGGAFQALFDLSTPPEDGDTFVYDAEAGKFVPQAASGGGSGVQVATVEISSAELLAMHLAGQAKVLLAGIADKIIEPLSAHFLFHPGADAYNPADNGSTLNVRWNGSAGTNITPTMWSVYGLGTNAATFTRDSPGEFGVTLDGVMGAPLTIDHDQAITGGNGTLTVTVAYLVV